MTTSPTEATSPVTVHVMVGYCPSTQERISQAFATRDRADKACQERVDGVRPGSWIFKVVSVDM